MAKKVNSTNAFNSLIIGTIVVGFGIGYMQANKPKRDNYMPYVPPLDYGNGYSLPETDTQVIVTEKLNIKINRQQ